MLKYDSDNNNTNENEDRNEKNKIFFTLVIFALAILLIVIVANIKPLKAFFAKVLDILSPIIIGAAIAYILNPLLKLLEFKAFGWVKNKKLVRALSLILTYVIALLFLALIVSILLPRVTNSIIEIGNNYEVYIAKATDIINKAISNFSSNSEFFNAEQLKKIVSDMISSSSDLFYTISSYIVSFGKTLFTTLKNFLLAMFISVYMLISKEKLYAQVTKAAKALFSNNFYQTAFRYTRIANETFGKYFVGKLFDSCIISAITFLLLSIFGLSYPMLIAAIIGIFNLIPYLGIFFGALLSAFIVLIASPEKELTFLIIIIAVQQIDSNIIAPKILGKSAGISSLGVIVAVTVMGAYFGIVGMILGVPVFAIIISICKELIEGKLQKKGLKTSTVDYYDDPEYTGESRQHRTFSKTIWDTTVHKVLHKDEATDEPKADDDSKNKE